MLTQWRTVFNRGFHLCPIGSILAGVICFLNALLTQRYGATSNSGIQGSSQVLRLILTGVSLISIVPFTLKFIVALEEDILGKETRLRTMTEFEKADRNRILDQTEESIIETRKMLKHWSKLNYARTGLPFLATAIAWSIW